MELTAGTRCECVDESCRSCFTLGQPLYCEREAVWLVSYPTHRVALCGPCADYTLRTYQEATCADWHEKAKDAEWERATGQFDAPLEAGTRCKCRHGLINHSPLDPCSAGAGSTYQCANWAVRMVTVRTRERGGSDVPMCAACAEWHEKKLDAEAERMTGQFDAPEES